LSKSNNKRITTRQFEEYELKFVWYTAQNEGFKLPWEDPSSSNILVLDECHTIDPKM